MGTVNEDFLDALIRHQIYLLRLSGNIRNKITDILNKTEEDIADKIRSKLLNHQGLDTVGFRKLQSLEKYIKTVRLKAWDEVDETWFNEIVELAKQEPAFAAVAVKTVSPVLLDLVLPPPALLKSLVTSQPFEGRTLKQWSQSLRQSDLQRISDQIKIGMVQGETSPQIARRIVGTAALRGTNGVTEITRRQAEAITRTAINFIGNAAKSEFYKQNKTVFKGEQFVATLDSRTTPICRSLDGNIYPVGEGPMPPLHFSCRSVRVAVVLDELVGVRPFKASTEKQLIREYTEKHNLKAKTRNGLPRGHKGAFDEFASKRVRELTGQVPAKVTYQEWLTRQSKEFQQDVLGKTKAKLFRDGKLTLDKFVNRNGDELTLKELSRKHREAFLAAGLDPDEYL